MPTDSAVVEQRTWFDKIHRLLNRRQIFFATSDQRIFEMAHKTRTTETLRETLFQTIDDLLAQKVDAETAAQVNNLAMAIIKTADLELKYALTVEKLDMGKTGIGPGKILLVEQKS